MKKIVILLKSMNEDEDKVLESILKKIEIDIDKIIRIVDTTKWDDIPLRLDKVSDISMIIVNDKESYEKFKVSDCLSNFYNNDSIEEIPIFDKNFEYVNNIFLYKNKIPVIFGIPPKVILSKEKYSKETRDKLSNAGSIFLNNIKNCYNRISTFSSLPVLPDLVIKKTRRMNIESFKEELIKKNITINGFCIENEDLISCFLFNNDSALENMLSIIKKDENINVKLINIGEQ